MENENFDERSTAFLQWFKALPGATFADSIDLQDLRGKGAGRGIVATQDIEPETVLFTIPRDAIMTMATSRVAQIPEMKHIFSPDDSDMMDETDEESAPDSWAKLILVMIYEYLLGPESKWKPYSDVIPSTFETPMFWPESDLEQLQSSALRSKVGRESAESMFQEKIIPHIRKYPSMFASSSSLDDQQLVALCHRMGSAIMAYAFDLNEDRDEDEEEENEDGWVEDKDQEDVMGMVPMADMMNADAEFNAHVNHEDGALVVMSLRHIKQGEEILNYYGPHPNSELLRRYGYVSEKHARYDVVEVPWQLVQNILQQQLGFGEQTLAKLREKITDVEFEDTFVLERETGDPSEEGLFTQQAQFTAFPEDLMEQLKAALKIIAKSEPGLLPDKRKRDEVQRAVMSKVLQTLLSSYDTTLAEDELLLKSGGLADRLRMTVIVRAGEKKLLTEAMHFLQQQQQQQGSQEDDGPAAKRQRT